MKLKDSFWFSKLAWATMLMLLSYSCANDTGSVLRENITPVHRNQVVKATLTNGKVNIDTKLIISPLVIDQIKLNMEKFDLKTAFINLNLELPTAEDSIPTSIQLNGMTGEDKEFEDIRSYTMA